MERDSSSPELSRSSSPAQSDATEVPDFQQRGSGGPRTVASDIEHIKSLISRADGVPRGPEASITAQVFRRRSGSASSTGSGSGPVSQQRIFHELDLLKKRIRNEQQHVRRPSQVDPETESESEAIDERDEELESIREQLHQERQQSEDLLANAEFRIDNLMKEREDLTQMLDANKTDFAKLHGELQEAKSAHSSRLTLEQQENESLREQMRTSEDLHLQQVKSAEARLAEMEQQIAEYEQRTKAAEESVKHKETELHELLAAKEHELADVQGHLTELQQKQYDQSAELQGKNAELSQATDAHEAALHESRGKEEEISSLKAELARAVEAHASANADWTEEVARMRVEREQILNELDKGWSSKAEEAARSHHAELSSAQNDFEAKLAELGADSAQWSTGLDERAVGRGDTASKTELAALDAQHQKVLRHLELARQEDIESLRQENEQAIRALIRNHQIELGAAEDTHRQQLFDLEMSLRDEKDSKDFLRSTETSARHQEALERAIGQAHESSQAEIIALKKSHKRELSRFHADAEKDLAAALANADEDLEERLHAQSKAHRKELDKLNESLSVELTHLHLKLEEASQMREEEMQEAESQYHTALVDLRQRLEAAEQTSVALQARLEAESIGRAEAERSLAGLKRQRYSETPVESKASLRRSIIVLEAERDSLARQLAGSPTSTYSDAQEVPPEIPGPDIESEDSNSLKQRVATAERERDAAQNAAEKKIDEMTRQNDFLVKELEMAMAQRSAKQTSRKANTNASVQTEPVAVIDPEALKEPKADAAMSKAAKLHRPDLRRSLTDIIEASADKRRSFEDYLLQAQAELSEMGHVTNANETLFAEKTKEHAGTLQAAKDQLSSEYQRKFRALQAEKDRMERVVSAKSAADFTREHVELFASYGINHEEPTKQVAMFHNLPSRKKKAIRIGEQGLVTEYHRRLTKRKSQIAMKHAEKFHSLTRDFHQKTTDLVNGKEGVSDDQAVVKEEKDRGIDEVATTTRPTRVNKLPRKEERTTMADPKPATIDKTQLENAILAATTTTPKSQLPKRISLSKPRTVSSIPRAAPFSGRPKPDATAESQRSTTPENSRAPTRDTDTLRSLRTDSEPFSTPTTTVRTANGTVSTKASPSRSVGARNEALSQLAPDEDGLQGRSPSLPSLKTRPRMMNHSSRMIFGARNV